MVSRASVVCGDGVASARGLGESGRMDQPTAGLASGWAARELPRRMVHGTQQSRTPQIRAPAVLPTAPPAPPLRPRLPRSQGPRPPGARQPGDPEPRAGARASRWSERSVVASAPPACPSRSARWGMPVRARAGSWGETVRARFSIPSDTDANREPADAGHRLWPGCRVERCDRSRGDRGKT